MATRAGVAYVDIEGDFTQLNRQVSSHFSNLATEAKEAGKKAGAALGDGLSGGVDDLDKQASGSFAKLADQAKETGKRAGAALGKGMAVGVGAAGAVAGALFMKGLNDAITAEQVNSKLAAQLGSTKATSKKTGKLAGKIYADAYGESLSEVNDAIRGVVQNDLAKKTGKDVEGLTKKTLDLAAAFDVDVAGATRGVGQLIRTGLVKNANEAFDIVTKGFIKGGDKAEDLLDTLNEYSTQWRKLGINAKVATGILVQGLQAGARDSDIVADALKEFSIRAIDGSKLTGEGFKALGLNHKDMAARIAKGGDSAAKALDVTLDRLRKIKDPVKQAAAASALFGTQSEDLGAALFALDPSKAVGALGKVEGSAKKLGDTLGDNVAAKFESLKRKTFQGFQEAAAKHVLPALTDILGYLNDPALTDDQRFTKIGDRFGKAFEDAKPAITKAIEGLQPIITSAFSTLAPMAASGFLNAFLDAPVWAQLLIGGVLFKRLGMAAAFTAAGRLAGGAMATGMAGSVAAGGAGTAAVRASAMGGVGALGGPIGLAIGAAITAAIIVGMGTKEDRKKKAEEIAQDFKLKVPVIAAGDTQVFKDLERLMGMRSGAIKFNQEEYDKLRASVKNAGIEIGTTNDELKATEEEFKKLKTVFQPINDAIDRLRSGTSQSMDSLRGNVRLNMRAIKINMGSESAEAKQALARNFSAGIENIKRSMEEGTISVKEGNAKIKEYTVKSMKLFGFNEKQALAYAEGRDPLTGKSNKTMGGKQRGGYINMGAASGDSVHAMLERDEYVLNRKAVKRIGKSTLDRINFGEAPRFGFQGGGIVELLHPFNDPKGHGGSNSHLHIAMSTTAAIVALGKKLQKLGWLVGEHPAFGGVGGMHAKDGYHYIARAIDVNWPDAGQEAAKIKALLPSLGDEAGAAAAAGAPAVAAPTISAGTIQGPGSALKATAQAAINLAAAGAQNLVDAAAASVVREGAEPGLVGPATGNGADLMKRISKSRGWNFADWWEIDRRESSHGANLANPTSSARLRGQFLDFNYGKYGPGSDPGQNPSMAQQIQSMAMYIAERYGNPTKARAWHDAHNWYRSGGLVSLLQGGGGPGREHISPTKVGNDKIGASKEVKKRTPNSRVTDAMKDALAKVGAKALQDAMDKLDQEADKFADWAQRAGNIENTDALQQALNAEMTARGGRSSMSQQQLLALFPAAQQDAFIDAWRRGNATFNGGIQSDWLSQELNQLLQWRLSLIDNPPVFQSMAATAYETWKGIKAAIAEVKKQIAQAEREKERVEKAKQDQHSALVDAKKELAEEQRKKNPDKARVKRLENQVDKYRRNEAVLHHGSYGEMKDLGLIPRINGHDAFKHSVIYYHNQLGQWAKDNTARETSAEAIGGTDGKGGRIGDLNEAISSMATSLSDVHGLGSTLARFVSPSEYQLGTLGGTILSVQNSILGLTSNPLRASAEEAAAEPSPAEERSKEILADLLREANLRTAVSQAQYDVFRNLPFGGSFKQGGTVAGPIGAPRIILAHGGEVVIPNDANYAPGVSLHFANGMEWLRQFVDIRVDNQTRAQSRRSERQLPGQPGLLR